MGNQCVQLKKKKEQYNLSQSKTFDSKIFSKPSQILHKNYTSFKNNIMRQSERQHQNRGIHGLTNLGNTCFINTSFKLLFQAIQCLSNIQPLNDYIHNNLHSQELNKINKMGSHGNMIKAYANIIKYYQIKRFIWSGHQQKANHQEDLEILNNLTRDFYQQISVYGQRFSEQTQEDCHEFLIFLLDILHEDINRIADKKYQKEQEYFGNVEKDINSLNQFELYAMESWEHSLLREQSVFVDLFQSQYKSTLTCQICNSTSHKFDNYNHIQLPIYGKNLYSCLEKFQSVEMLQESEQWFCIKCKTKTESTKKIDLWKTPNILIIQLKRFKYQENRGEKISDLIDFPINDLDLNNFIKGPLKYKPTYNLFAIAQHQGSLFSGHYTALAKNKYDKKWYKFDDKIVTKISTDNIVNSKAYILFYQLNSVDEFRRQTISDKSSWPHLNNQAENVNNHMIDEQNSEFERSQIIYQK